MMRRLIAAFAAALFAFGPLAASAQTLIYPSGIASGAPTTCASVAVSTPCLNISQAWTGTATFSLDRANVSADPGPSNAASLLIDRQYLGVSKFSVTRAGVGVFASSIQSGGTVSSSAGGGASIGADGSGKPQVIFGSGGFVLNGEAANTLALRNGLNPQTINIYNTYTDASNYERLASYWSSNIAVIEAQNAGTGTYRQLTLVGNGVFLRPNGPASATHGWKFTSAGLLAETDNADDIGASGANRPRNVFVAGSVTAASGFIGKYSTTTPGLVSALITCTGNAGTLAMVTDATVVASGNFGAAVTGGGGNTVPVYCDGTSWKIG